MPRHGHELPEGLCYTFAFPCELPLLRVDIEHDGKDQVQHNQRDEKHEGPGPNDGGPEVLLGQLRPIELRLSDNLEANAYRRLYVRELFDAAPEHERSADRVRTEAREQDDHKVEDVDQTHLQSADDDAEARLSSEGHKEPDHENKVIDSDEQPVPSGDEGNIGGGVVEALARIVHLWRRVGLPNRHDGLHVRLHRAQLGINVLVAENGGPAQHDNQPLQQEPSGGRRPSERALADVPARAPDFEDGGAEQHESEGGLGRHRHRREVGLQEDRVHGQLREDVPRAAERQDQLVGLQAGAADLTVQQERTEREVLRLLVEPTVMVHVVQPLLDLRVGHVRGEDGAKDTLLSDARSLRAPGEPIGVRRPHHAQSPTVVLHRLEGPVVELDTLLERDRDIAGVLAVLRRGDRGGRI
mmetsp:Transcript_55230/g.159958  ORF Transcript_55230/g.159958 Transcript_55230/m.159958 type:complete len:413 (+) Transcript_55230:572-1810(+)